MIGMYHPGLLSLIAIGLTALLIQRGAALTYRVALWHPDLVSHVITVCVPYFPPSKVYIPLEELVKTHIPSFAYQLQLKSGELEKAISTKDEIRQFLIGLYGGRTDDGKPGFDVSKGVLLENLKGLKPSKLLSKEVRNNQS